MVLCGASILIGSILESSRLGELVVASDPST